MNIVYTKNPEEAAKLGYVNPGTDRRIAGTLGKRLAAVQRELSFKEARPPRRHVAKLEGGTLVERAVAPSGHEHFSIAVPIAGRWATVRFGYRYDPNWGDVRTIGHNPNPEIVGGYIFDLVIKLNATQPFIEAR